jgi:Ca-activated chloride channel family protein
MNFTPIIPVPLLVIVALVLLAVAVIGTVRAASRGVRLSWILRTLMVVLLVLIAVRPAIPGDDQGPTARGGLEVYFAVDTTSSMAAEDYDGTDTRLSGVKADIVAITDALAGAQFSLVTFDSASVQRVPVTSDATALTSAVSVLTQEVTVYSQGSSVDEPVELLTSILSDAQEKNPGNDRVLFYLGDGEQTNGAEPGSFEALAPLLTGGGVLGYGTAEGGRMLEFDGFADDYSQLGYIQDTSQSPATDALSMIDETELGVIAQQLGVTYTHRTEPGSVADVLAGISVGDLEIEKGEPGGPIELYWIFAIPLGLLLILELVRLSGAILELRPRRETTS